MGALNPLLLCTVGCTLPLGLLHQLVPRLSVVAFFVFLRRRKRERGSRRVHELGSELERPIGTGKKRQAKETHRPQST